MKQEIIRLGSACNQKCLFCNQEGVFDVKDKKAILRELLECKKKGAERLVISGGEPTLFKKELLFTVGTGKKFGFHEIEIQSNAVLLSNEEYAQDVVERGLTRSMISLHSFDPHLSDELTQAPGTFDKTIQGIKNLIQLGVETTINIVINKENYKQVREYVEYVHKNLIGNVGISLSVVVPGKLTQENQLLPEYGQIAKYLEEAYDYCIEHNIIFQNPGCGIPVCYVPNYYKYSLEYQNYKTGNVYDEFILEKNKQNKIKSKKCKQCIFDQYCLGLWKGYVETYGLEGVRPIIGL